MAKQQSHFRYTLELKLSLSWVFGWWSNFGPNLQIFAESFDTFKQELLLRSSLETQKLELMTEISSLRLKHASLERENIELKDRVVGKSTGDLSFIDSSSNAGLGGCGSSRIWDKPPIGPERAASPAHSISVDPSVTRSRLASSTSEHQHAPPQRTRVSFIHTIYSHFNLTKRNQSMIIHSKIQSMQYHHESCKSVINCIARNFV